MCSTIQLDELWVCCVQDASCINDSTNKGAGSRTDEQKRVRTDATWSLWAGAEKAENGSGRDGVSLHPGPVDHF